MSHPSTLTTHQKQKVVTYGAQQPTLQVLGEINVLVETKHKFLATKFFVINTNHKNLLSGRSALALGIINSNVSEINTCSITSNSSTHKEKRLKIKTPKDHDTIPQRLRPNNRQFPRYPFSAVRSAKLKDYQVELKNRSKCTTRCSERTENPLCPQAEK